MENNFSIDFDYVFTYVFTYILMSHNMIIVYLYLPYFHVSNSALFFAKYSGTFRLPRRSLDALEKTFIRYNNSSACAIIFSQRFWFWKLSCIQLLLVDCPLGGPAMRSFDIFFDISQNNLLNKHGVQMTSL